MLLHAADAAYPFDLALLPEDVHHVLGYVGAWGATPHIWTAAEVAAVQAGGLRWHPIWTVPQRALTAADGHDAATRMLAALPTYPLEAGCPVFLDVESSAYNADPAGAVACVNAWRAGMAAGGHPTAVAYLPASTMAGWIANWTGVRPDTLPPTVKGWQYASDRMLGKPFDLSVFDPATLGATIPAPTREDTMTPDELTAAVRAAINSTTVSWGGQTHNLTTAAATAADQATQAQRTAAQAVEAVAALARIIAGQAPTAPGAGTTPAALADALRAAADHLSPAPGGTA